MNALDESTVREQLARAVAAIDPVAPPLDSVRARARKRARTRRTTGGFLVVALAGATAAIVAAVVVAAPGGSQQLKTANIPPATHASLASFATANGAASVKPERVVGPIRYGAATYGVFTTKAAIVAAVYVAGKWRVDGPLVRSLGGGSIVTGVGFGPSLGGEPSIAVRVIGGDATYQGSVLVRGEDGWTVARFGSCGHHGMCGNGSNAEPYAHFAKSGLVSVSNDCTPYCAAGQQFRVRWTWAPSRGGFVATSVRKISRS